MHLSDSGLFHLASSPQVSFTLLQMAAFHSDFEAESYYTVYVPPFLFFSFLFFSFLFFSFLFCFLKDFVYLFMGDTQRESET